MSSWLKVYTLPLIAAKRNGALDKQLDLASLAGFGVYTSTLRRGVHPKIALQVAIKTGANVPHVAKMARKYASSQFTLNPEEKDDLALKTGIKMLSTSVRNNLTGIPMYARNNIMTEIQNLLSFAAAFDNVFAINPKNKKLKGKGSFNSWVTNDPLYGGADPETDSGTNTGAEPPKGEPPNGEAEVLTSPPDDTASNQDEPSVSTEETKPEKRTGVFNWFRNLFSSSPKDNPRQVEEGQANELNTKGSWGVLSKIYSRFQARKPTSYRSTILNRVWDWMPQILALGAMIFEGYRLWNPQLASTTTGLTNTGIQVPPQNTTGLQIPPQNNTLFRYDQPIPIDSQNPYQWAQFLNATRLNTNPVDPETFQRIVDAIENADKNAATIRQSLLGEIDTVDAQNQELRQTQATQTRTIEEYEDKIQKLEGEIEKLKPERVQFGNPQLFGEELYTINKPGTTYDELWGRSRPWDIVKDEKLIKLPDGWLKELNAEQDPIVRWREFGKHVAEAKATDWLKSDAQKFDERMEVLKHGMNEHEIHAYESGQNIANAETTAKGNDTYQPPPGFFDKYGPYVWATVQSLISAAGIPFFIKWWGDKKIKDGIMNGDPAYKIESDLQTIASTGQAIQNVANIVARAKMDGIRYDKEFQQHRMQQRYELAKNTTEQKVQRENARRNALIAAASTAIPLAIGGVPGLVAGLSSGLSGALGGLFGNRVQAAVPPAPGALPPAPGGPGAPPPAQGPLGAQINHPLLRPIDADAAPAVLAPGAAPGGPLAAPVAQQQQQQRRRRAIRDRRQIEESLITFSDLVLTDAEWNEIKDEIFAGTSLANDPEGKNIGFNTFRSLAMNNDNIAEDIDAGLARYYRRRGTTPQIRGRNNNQIARNLAVILGGFPYYIDRTVRYIEAMEAGDEDAAAMVAASQKKEGKTFVENFGKISQMINALNPTIKQLTEAYKPQTPYLLKPFELPKSQYTFEPMKAPTIEDLYGKEITILPPQEAVPQYDYVEQVSAIPYGTSRHLPTNVQPINMQAAKRPRSATNSDSPPKRRRGNRGNWSSLE